MVFGIIAEGKGDCAVLENILWNIIGDDDELRFLRPEFGTDENDLQNKGEYAAMETEQFSSWTLVRKDCLEKNKFRRFLSENITKEERRIILQIDTAECDLYDVQRPNKKTPTYSSSHPKDARMAESSISRATTLCHLY